jgi:hypothetical protein
VVEVVVVDENVRDLLGPLAFDIQPVAVEVPVLAAAENPHGVFRKFGVPAAGPEEGGRVGYAEKDLQVPVRTEFAPQEEDPVEGGAPRPLELLAASRPRVDLS